jgi:signal peptidase I
MRKIRIFVFFISFLFLFILNFSGLKFAHSSTPSLESRNFFVDTKNKSYSKGNLITFRYQGQEKYKYKKNDYFTKEVSCISGDVLVSKDNKYYCNKKYLGEVKKFDLDLKPIKPFIFNGIIPENKIFVLGEHEFSFDSRYFGFVDNHDIVGKTVAIF